MEDDIIRFDDQSVWTSLRTHVVTVQRVICEPSWGDHGRSEYFDSFGRLYCVLRGEGWVSHHGSRFHIRPGWLSVIPAQTVVRLCCDEPMELYWLHYHADILGALEPFETMGWDYEVPYAQRREMAAIWEPLLDASCRQSPAAPLLLDAGLRQLFAYFARTSRGKHHPSIIGARRFYPVFSYIENNLNRMLTLHELASIVHLHPTYFSNLFTKSVGLSPLQYVNRKKVQRAQSWLLSEDASLEEISAQLGFNDAFYFSRVFKKITGMSPDHYRKNAGCRP